MNREGNDELFSLFFACTIIMRIYGKEETSHDYVESIQLYCCLHYCYR